MGYWGVEQVAGIEPAPSDWQTDARPSSHTCTRAESRNRTGLAALEAQSFALNKPRVGGRTRVSLHEGSATKRRRPGAAARNRTVPDRVPSDCSTLELRRQDWWSRRVPPPESLLARQARGLPHNPVAGRRGIEPRPADLESARPPWPPTYGAAYEDRTRLTRSTIELRHQSHHAAFGAPRANRTRLAAFRKRGSASSGRSMG